MTDRPNKPGVLFTVPSFEIGSTTVLIPNPVSTTYGFTDVPGITSPYESAGGGPAPVPTTGQIWPRGNR